MPGAIGPVLVQGPVEVVLDDGTIRSSDRPVVALCACGRSGSYPFCDTSHRRRSRPRRGSDDGDSRPRRGSASGDQGPGAVGERDTQ
ncbi:CDGSH iron-sulfur domain-containing protein [Actinospica sp. MGRD01-02]|uniref:CDGSH iron-sulfur domain-containing protein n=1 Tax=Actinospica acidithermotolerans TaxID=2828514 RepID=A0A941EF55_9ACTN|nr:CDGSH iron-sulfur domain-containing protein [Actinospica acidithermotolerans]MBR7829278.1 CDGSH iron-sulfur domain-containing protein [Actinospica acidithermotolerans]